MSDVIARTAARVLLTDRAGRVLLFHGTDPARPEMGNWWFTPGGGVEPGESLSQAARREVLEETGHVLPDDLGPVVLRLTSRYSFEGQSYEQVDHFFRVTAEHSRVDYSGWTDVERRSVHAHRWWTPGDLGSSSDPVFPVGLREMLTART